MHLNRTYYSLTDVKKQYNSNSKIKILNHKQMTNKDLRYKSKKTLK